MTREQIGKREQDGALSRAQKSIETARADLQKTERTSALRKINGWLRDMRENPLVRGPMRSVYALMLGVPLAANAAEMEPAPVPLAPSESAVLFDAETANPVPDASQEQPAETAQPWEVTVENVDKKFPELIASLQAEESEKWSRLQEEAMYEMRAPQTDKIYLEHVAMVARAVEGGQAAPEYYARTGRPEWTPYQRALFSTAPVGERFTELHPEYRNLTGIDFLDAYPEMAKLSASEFRFSNHFRFLAEDARMIYLSEVETMEPKKAAELFESLVGTFAQNIGLAEVIRFTYDVRGVLPEGHPVLKYIEEQGIRDLSPLVSSSDANVVHLDQSNGKMRVLRKIGNEYLVIDTFPVIGGRQGSPEFDVRSNSPVSEYTHVPDMVMEVAYVDRAKTSWSWYSSWVPQGAPIREVGEELQYRHPANGTWYDLTGPNAAFFPDRNGTAIRPFDRKVDPMDLALVRAASRQAPDGTKFVPKAWSKAELVERNNGEVPMEWRWNDFGSMAIRLNTEDGTRTNINIHSSPKDDMDDFLPGKTHGCFSTYGDYVRDLVDTYGVGSDTKVIVTNGDYDLNKIAK